MPKKHAFKIVYKNYVRIAEKIRDTLGDRQPESIQLLDWGANDGILDDVLFRLHYTNITAFDVGKERAVDEERFPHLKQINRVVTDDLVRLPFADQSFDVVVSCGVLEHAAFIHRSLEEIHRVLKDDGYFFVFHFPQKTSWTEWIASWHRTSGHERKYTVRELHQTLQSHGFEIEHHWKFNLLPKTLYPLPTRLLRYYSKMATPIFFMDAWLSRIPLLNLLCNSIECSCVKVTALR